jgi:hypothetical protein
LKEVLLMDDSIIMLQDENGNMIEFEAIDCFEFNDKTYFALLEVMPEGQESDEVVMMRVEFGETEEDTTLVTIDSEDELMAAFNEFVRRDDEMSEDAE